MTTRRTRPIPALLSLGLLLPLALTACGGAPEPDTRKATGGSDFPVVATACGHNSEITAPPERAITMNQGATEVLLALGLEESMAGTAYLDDSVPQKWRAAYDSVEVLSAEYPDQETVLAVEPDFVYSSYSSAFGPDAAGPQGDLDGLGIGSLLSPFGCEQDHLSAEVAFTSVWDEIEIVADVFGVPDRADALEEAQRAQLDQLAVTMPGKDVKVFWYDSGDKTAFAGAGEGGPQLILDAVGATNVFADLGGGWADVSWEQVVAADPEVIVLADASWSSADEKIAYLESDPVLKGLTAVRNEAYVVLPFSETTPGVRLADGAVSVGEQLAGLG